jgi:hypothetical protein
MGSSSGYVDIEVSAATSNGAKEQLQNVYGAQQIVNLREIGRSNGLTSSSSSSDSGGLLSLCAIGFVIYLLVNYWMIALGIGAAVLLLWILYVVFAE